MIRTGTNVAPEAAGAKGLWLPNAFRCSMRLSASDGLPIDISTVPARPRPSLPASAQHAGIG